MPAKHDGRPLGARWVAALAVALILLGAAVLLGWALGLEPLTAVVPGLATMKPNTALGFLACGVALWLQRPFGSGSPWAIRLAQGSGVAVALLGLLTAVEYRTGWAGGFDAILFLAEGQSPSELRMSEATAWGFVMGGTAVALLRLPRGWPLVHGAALALATLSGAALVGYLYGVEALYAVDPFGSVAIHTALAFLLVAVGVLLTRPDRGIVGLVRSDTAGGSTSRVLFPTVVLVPFVLGRLHLWGLEGGLYPPAFGSALFAVATAALCVGLVWLNARRVDRAAQERRNLESQISHGRKMDAVGRLAGGIAHDFNNVLTAVINTADLALDAPDPESVRDDLLTIRGAGVRAAKLTSRLLAVSRRQLLEPRVLSINEVLRENEAILRSLVPSSVQLEWQFAPDLGNARLDRSQLEQIVVNLVVNAVHAMPEGGTLTIRTANTVFEERYADRHADVAPGAYTVLEVADTGIGMDHEVMDRIFEPFFTTRPAGEGTGLGLASVHGVVRQSGGAIWVYSEPGLGTTFKLCFPRVAEAAERVAEVAHSGTLRGSERVLVVDDDEAVRRAVVRALASAGYRVESAENGRAALEVIASSAEPFDLLLTDVVMPELGARGLVEQARAWYPDLRVIQMSGYAGDAVARVGLEEGSGGILAKPFTMTELHRRVRDTLDVAAAHAGVR